MCKWREGHHLVCRLEGRSSSCVQAGGKVIILCACEGKVLILCAYRGKVLITVCCGVLFILTESRGHVYTMKPFCAVKFEIKISMHFILV